MARLKAGHEVILQVDERVGTWNPARKPADRLFGTGRAIYSLDDLGNVHLNFHSIRGDRQHYEGRVPELFEATTWEASRRKFRLAYAAYGVSLLIGFGAGFLLTHGKGGTRLVGGLVGVIAAMLIASVVFTFLRIAMSTGRMKRNP